MNQNRQPKGTQSGGQFAPDVNPESTLDLSAESEKRDLRADIVEAQENVDLIFARYHSRDVILNSDASEAFDRMTTIVERQKEIIADLEAQLADARQQGQSSIGDDRPGRVEVSPWIDDEYEALDVAVESASRLSTAQLARIAYEAEQPFKIGTLLENGTEIRPWAEGVHGGNVVVQVWRVDDGDEDADCEGWEPRAIARILHEQFPRRTEFGIHDIEDVFDDPLSGVDKIAVRPNVSEDELLEMVSNALSNERFKQ